MPFRAATCLVIATWSARGADDSFETRIRPLLAKECFSCHGQAAMGGLRLDQAAPLRRLVVPGKADDSVLIQAVRHTHARVKMPPGRKLSDADIRVLVAWVDSGAPMAEGRPGLWSTAPLAKPPGAGGIDAVARQQLAARGLVPNARADRRTLRRRLASDLSGLPPAPDDGQPVEAFVDQLLGSKAFAERWARHWLDVARYGEEDFSGTAPRPYPAAWRYRDWVIQAFERDMPYDLFLQAQIAGDLLPPERGFTTADYLPGLGLFGAGPWYYGIAMPPQARADERHDRVDMVTRGMLGLSVACARCHDHKYDPVSQKEYYALAGVFASSPYKEIPLAPPEQVEAFKAHEKKMAAAAKALDEFEEKQSIQLAEMLAADSARYLVNAWRCRQGLPLESGIDRPLLDRWETYLATRDERHPYLNAWHDARTEAEVREAAAAFQARIVEIIEEKKALDEENRKLVIQAASAASKPARTIILPFGYRSDEDFNPGAEIPTKSLAYAKYQIWGRLMNGKGTILRFDGRDLDRWLSGVWRDHLDRLRAAKTALEKAKPAEYPYLMAIGEGEPWDLPLNVRGNPFELGVEVPRAFPAVLGGGELRDGSGRLQLARKVAGHPMAARVMVNRIWQALFGAGLVRTPSNFGTMGDRPAQAALLEYLAARFVELGSSPKKLIREIVLSETYQASSLVMEANQKIDPDNRYFWRQNRRRLDAEAMRDQLLDAAGELDRRAGGESAALDDKFSRRAIYARVSRYQQEATLSLFDFPSASVTCEQRASTNVPLQRLYFLNSDFLHARAADFAKRVAGAGDAIGRAYEILFQRAPTARERELGAAFVARDGWKAYAQVLLSSNEFAYVD